MNKLQVTTKLRIMDAIDAAFKKGEVQKAEQLYKKLNAIAIEFWWDYINYCYPVQTI